MPENMAFNHPNDCQPRARSQAMPFGWLGYTAKIAARRGLDIRADLAEAGVVHFDGGLIRDDTPLGPADFALISAFLVNASDDDELQGAGPRMRRGTATVASRAMATARTLRAAINLIGRVFGLAGAFCDLALSEREGDAIVEIRADGDEPHGRSIAEEMLAIFLQQQFSYYLGFPVPLTGFTTSALDHPYHGRHHPLLLCPMRAASRTALIFPAAYLELRSAAKDFGSPIKDAQLFWVANHPSMTGKAVGDAAGPLSQAVYRLLKHRDASFTDCSTALSQSTAAQTISRPSEM